MRRFRPSRRTPWDRDSGHARLRPGDPGPSSHLPGACPRAGLFFPHDWLRGYVDFAVAPPHNEPDLGRCSQSQAVIVSAGGANSTCNAYARYLMGGYLEVQPFGKTFARHVFVFFTPTFSFGNNVPQFKYTASMAPIAFERSVGIGIELPKNFEIPRDPASGGLARQVQRQQRRSPA